MYDVESYFFFVLSFSLSLFYIRCIFRSCVAIGFMQMFGEQKIDVENIDCGGGGISMRVGFFLFFFFWKLNDEISEIPWIDR